MKTTSTFRIFVVCLILMLGVMHLHCSSSTTAPADDDDGPKTWYVDSGATGAGTGANWTDAFTTIQPAVDAARDGEEIWVVGGTYTSGTTDRSTAVVDFYYAGVSLHGGFAGTETMLSERNVYTNPTILDGEDNAYHVVVGADRCVLDGFTVTGGNADGTLFEGRGGGIFLDDKGMTISHCIVEYNYADYGGGLYGAHDESVITTTIFRYNDAGAESEDYAGGGGMLLLNSSTTQISNCEFDNNTASRYGGGLLVWGGEPVLTDCEFEDCSVPSNSNGGAVYVDNLNFAGRLPAFHDCVFTGNSGGYGAAMHLFRTTVLIDGCEFLSNIASMGGGAINSYNASPDIKHSLFVENEAAGGGGIYLFGPLSGVPIYVFNCLFSLNEAATGNGGGISISSTSASITNCTIASNLAANGGGVNIVATASPALTNTIVWGNTATATGHQILNNAIGTTVQYCCIDQAEYIDVNYSFRLDPLWVTGPGGDYYLSNTATGQGSTSPCVDAGAGQASLYLVDSLTTRTDDVVDSGVADIGYHYTPAD